MRRRGHRAGRDRNLQSFRRSCRSSTGRSGSSNFRAGLLKLSRAAASGDNAAENNYALEPFSSTKGALVVHLNSSLATPASNIADPTKNLYTAAAQAGFHVLALASRSSLVVGITCSGDAACFGRPIGR